MSELVVSEIFVSQTSFVGIVPLAMVSYSSFRSVSEKFSFSAFNSPHTGSTLDSVASQEPDTLCLHKGDTLKLCWAPCFPNVSLETA